MLEYYFIESNVITVDKTIPWSITFCDIGPKVAKLCSFDQVPRYKRKSTLLAWFQPKLNHLNMLFDLEFAYTGCSADQLKNK